MIQQGRERREAELDIKAVDVIRELAKIGFSNMGNYLTVTSDGDPYVDLSDLTEDQLAAISEVSVEDFTDGRGEDARDVRKIKFKLADKRAALVDLGRHFKLFTDKLETAVVVTHVDMTFRSAGDDV